MKLTGRILVLIFILSFSSEISGQHSLPGCVVNLEQLSDVLYLDTTLIPQGFDRATLLRLYDFLDEHVIANVRTPFPDHYGRLPVIVRYTPYSCSGRYPETTEGFAGWCDVVRVDCATNMTETCALTFPPTGSNEHLAFLSLVAIPEDINRDYEEQLWGITTHELAHTLGAIDGPRFVFYEYDNLLAPIDCVSDTYYWFGISSLFEYGWRGIVWEAFQNQCTDERCESLRTDVFRLDD